MSEITRTVVLSMFEGSIPKLTPALIPKGQAHKAIDCKFQRGNLQSWNEPLKLIDMDVSGKLTLIDCCWLDIPKCADIANSDSDCKEIYITGRNDYPEVGTLNRDNCEVTWSRLGVLCPLNPPSIMAKEVSDDEMKKSVEARSYVYQYVNRLGHRSAASPGSEIKLVQDGSPVVISGWDIPDESWGVTHIRIYRATSGVEPGNQMANVANSLWMFVDEIPITTVAYTDNKEGYLLQETLLEDVVIPPPAELKGITMVSSINALAGYMANRVYFSANNNFTNWPIWLDLEDNVCGIAEANGKLYVATDGRPYVIESAVDCASADCRKVLKHTEHYPMIGCGNDRMAVISAGVVYPSQTGLILLSDNRPPINITQALYTEEDWLAMLPNLMSFVAHRGEIYGFGPQASFIVQQPSSGEKADVNTHSYLSDKDVLHAFVARTGDLIITKKDGAYKWNGSTIKRPHLWVSGTFLTGTPFNFGAFVVQSLNGNENVKVKSDDRIILDRSIYKARQELRMPMWGIGSKYTITLTGNADVSGVCMAAAFKEIVL